jgi:hypothetical protein
VLVGVWREPGKGPGSVVVLEVMLRGMGDEGGGTEGGAKVELAPPVMFGRDPASALLLPPAPGPLPGLGARPGGGLGLGAVATTVVVVPSSDT